MSEGRRYEEVDEPVSAGRRRIGIIREPGRPPRRRAAGGLWDDYVNQGMTIPPEQATPERIARENAEAKKHGTGAYYDKKGRCHTPGRGILRREMQRRKFQMNDAGYGDCAGR